MNNHLLNRLTRAAFGGALVLALAAGVGACSSDNPVEPPAPTYSTITVFSANPNFSSVDFQSGSNTAVGVGYGTSKTMQAENAVSTAVTAKQPSGVQIGQALVNVDSTRSVWVFAGVDASGNNEVFGRSDTLPHASVSSPWVRVVNVTSTTGSVDLHVDSPTGIFIAKGIAYKEASEFTTGVSSANTQLVVTPSGRTDSTLAVISLADTLANGKYYTVVVYGNNAALQDQYKVKAQVLHEP